MDNITSKKIADRLRELRIRHDYSHDQVVHLMENMLGVSMSKSSLIKYETDDRSGNRAGTSRMNIEFLDCIARLYNVSTDYILCRTDIECEDITVRDIVDKTGLSEKTIELLISAKQSHTSGTDSKDARYKSLEKFANLLEDHFSGYVKLDKTVEEYSYDIFYYLEILLDAYINNSDLRRYFAYIIRDYKSDYDHFTSSYPTIIDLREMSEQLLIQRLVKHLILVCHLEDQEEDGILFDLMAKFESEDKLFPEDTDPFV